MSTSESKPFHPSRLFPDTTEKDVYKRQVTRLGQLDESTKAEVFAWLKRTPQVVLRLIDGVGSHHQGSYSANLAHLQEQARRFADKFGDGTFLGRHEAMRQVESEVEA